MFNSKMHNKKQIKVGSIATSETEVKDLIKAWVAISIAFGIIINRAFPIPFYPSFVVSSITVGTGFLFHELGHKLVAQRYGCFAEFRANGPMLLLAVFVAFAFNFVFAAPGAVMIFGPVGRRRNGKISLAGPAVNIILALLFLILLAGNPIGIVKMLAIIGFFVNSLLAMFNMLPFGFFDGRKVLAWNSAVFYAMFAASIVLFFFSQHLIFNYQQSLF
jgi:Zn-dependent protease